MKTSMSNYKFKVVTKDENGNVIGSVPFVTKKAASEFAKNIVLYNHRVHSAEISR